MATPLLGTMEGQRHISRVEELQARITGGSENSNEAPLPLASLTTHIATKRDHDVERTR
jgi:hypothetical protein